MVTTQNIDYLRCSFDAPLFVVQELVKDVLGSTWVETRGKNFYRSGRTAPCGAELWTDGFAQCMGTCLDMSGLSCAAVEDMRGFIGVLLRAGARFSRIDTALDVFDGPVTYDLIVDAMKADSVVSRARKDARDVGNYNPYTGAWKVTMGGRSSDSYLRIYNKAAEQRIDANWVRFELELKRENSQAMAMAYAYGDLENDPFIMRSICALFDVREGTQQSLYARPRVAWMEQVFSSRILAGVRNTLDIM